MNSHPMITKLVLAITIVLTLGTVIFSPAQQTPEIINIHPPPPEPDNKDVPIADYDAPLTADAQQSARRQKINRALNIKIQGPSPISHFMIKPDSESNYFLPAVDAPARPALPVKESLAIIVGEITSAKAYLSEDKTRVYSEFEIANPVILKNEVPEVLKQGKPISFIRGGGGIRFSNGKVIYRYASFIKLPIIGHKYLLFLNYTDPEGFVNDPKDAGLGARTGYELTPSGVIPLDGRDYNGGIIEYLSGMQSFSGMSEADFLNQVKTAIRQKADVMTNGDEK